jgi:hypothetical protein
MHEWKKIPLPFLGRQRVLMHLDHIQSDLDAGTRLRAI